MSIRKRVILLGLLLINVLVSLDTTILNSVAPIVVDHLGGEKYYAWLFAGYILLSTVTIPIYGKLADKYGRKKILLIALLGFLSASILCGLANNMIQLIVFRMVKGLAAGGVIPVTSVIVGDLLSVDKRGKFQGHLSLIWGVSAVVGPLIGSIILDLLNWRWIFFVNIPISILAFVFIAAYKQDKDLVVTQEKVNWLSSLFFILMIGSILAITIETTKPVILVMCFVVFLLLYVLSEKKSSNPLISTAIYKNKQILFFNINTFLFFLALFGLESYIPYFVQNEQNASVFVSGLVLGGISLGWVISSYPSSLIIKRYGYLKPILTGNFLIAFSTIPFLFYSYSTPLLITFLILTVHGFCYGLIQTTATIGSYEISNLKEKGLASSLQSFSRNIGTSLSIGYMGALVVKDPYDMLHGTVYMVFAALVISSLLLFVITKKKKTLI